MGVREEDLSQRMILVPTPPEREHWYAMLLLAQGWMAAAMAEALERDPPQHRTPSTSSGGRRPSAREGLRPCCSSRPAVPPALDHAQQEELKGRVQLPLSCSGMEMDNWYWRVVRRFVSERFGVRLCRSSCLNYLHRLGFAFKRPKKRLVKAN